MSPFLTRQLQCFEVRNTPTVLVTLVQQELFPDEIQCIQKGKSVDAKSKLASLSSFMDSIKVIRVGEACENQIYYLINASQLSYHQAILSQFY